MPEIRGEVGLDTGPYESGLARVEKATEKSAKQIAAEWAYSGRKAAEEHRTAAREMEAAGRGAVRALEQQARQWQQAEAEASRMVAQVHRDAQRQAEESARAAQRAQTQAAQTVKEAWQGVGSLGGQLSVGVTAPLLLLAKGASDAAMDVEGLKVGLQSLTGSAASAEKEYGELLAISRKPGLDLTSAVKGATNLQAVGMSAKQAERAVEQFGNAVALSGRGAPELEQITVQLAQMSAKSKVVAQDLRPIIEAGPRIAGVIKEAFGTVDSEQIAATLAANGKTSADFIDLLIDRLEKLPRAGETARNKLRNASDDLTRALADVGKAVVPAELALVQQLTPAVQGLTHSFATARPETQQAILGLVGFAAAVGPVAFGLNQVVEGGKSAKEVWKGVSQAGQAVTTFVKGLVAADAAATAATVTHTTAVAADSAVEVANTGALAANTAALEANAAAAGEAAAARGLLGRIGLGGAIGVTGLGVAGIVAAGAFTATKMAEASERARGIDPNATPGDWWNPWGDHGAKAADEAIQARQKEFNEARAAGQSPHQKLVAEAKTAGEGRAFADKQTGAEVARASEEQYQLRVQNVAVEMEAAPEAGRAKAEAEKLIPILRARQKELQDYAATLKEGSSERLTTVRQERALEQQVLQTQHAAARETEEAGKKALAAQKQAEERFRRIRIAGLDAQVQAARDNATGAPEMERARAEAAAAVPALVQKQQALAAEAQALMPAFSASGEAQEQYARLAGEAWAAQRQINQLQRSAAKEAETEAKRAAKEAEDTQNAWVEARNEALTAQAAAAPEGHQAQALAALKLPVLRQIEAEMTANLQTMAAGTEVYYHQVKEYWGAEAEIQKLQDDALKEREQAVLKAKEAARKGAAKALSLREAEVGLVEARLKNIQTAFGLSDRQASRLALPSLVAQFQAMAKPLAGEDEQEKIKRQTELETLGGKILGSAKGAHLNPRTIYAELSALARQADGGLSAKDSALLARQAGMSPRAFSRDLARFTEQQGKGDAAHAHPAAKPLDAVAVAATRAADALNHLAGGPAAVATTPTTAKTAEALHARAQLAHENAERGRLRALGQFSRFGHAGPADTAFVPGPPVLAKDLTFESHLNPRTIDARTPSAGPQVVVPITVAAEADVSPGSKGRRAIHDAVDERLNQLARSRR